MSNRDPWLGDEKTEVLLSSLLSLPYWVVGDTSVVVWDVVKVPDIKVSVVEAIIAFNCVLTLLVCFLFSFYISVSFNDAGMFHVYYFLDSC